MKNLPLLLICCLIFSACAAPIVVVSGERRYFEAACSSIGTTAEAIRHRDLRFSLDLDSAVIHSPVDAVHGKRLDALYSVDILSGFKFVQSEILQHSERKIVIDSIDVEIGDSGVMAETRPVFIIRISGKNQDGTSFSVEKAACGPRVASFQAQSSEAAQRSESANIAYLSAVILAILSIPN